MPETFTPAAPVASVRKPAKDAVLRGAVEVAREAAAAEAGEHLGEHLGFVLEGERLGTHYFASSAPGYTGWRWFVTVSRAPRSRTPAVCETGMLPGDGALLAPAWLPWSERLEPGDVGATDRLPYSPDDERLQSGFVATGDAEVDRVAIRELGLGRDRIMTRAALDAAATRWYEGAAGPDSPGSRAAGADCATCGFIVPLAGHLGALFGVCANEWSPDDGKVVALNHGCGAHSETDVVTAGGEWGQAVPHLDELELEVVASVERDYVELPGPHDDEPASEDELGAGNARDGDAPDGELGAGNARDGDAPDGELGAGNAQVDDAPDDHEDPASEDETGQAVD